MNILFYVEPLIEMGMPSMKDIWANRWGKAMIACLKDENCYIAMSDATAEKYNSEFGEHIIVFSQSELLKPFTHGYIEASSIWYFHSYSDTQMQYYISLMQSKFEEIVFDIIITWTQVPFFKVMYPDACIFHMEYSIFSRMPFPETMYLDPCGLYENNFLNRFKCSIENIHLGTNDKQLLTQLRQMCIESFEYSNIFLDDFIALRKKYKFLVLLPLQFSQYYGFYCLTNYTNQFDYLTGCLEKIPDDIGVVFTMHPDRPTLDYDAILYIQKKYNNAIFLENSQKIYAASQWMMPLIDGVITVSSSLGLQTLLFNKKLFAIGHDNMKYIADCSNLDNMYDVLESPMKDKDAFLWFLLTKYAIPAEILFTGEWLSKFLLKSKRRDIDENFFDCIENSDDIVNRHIKSINLNKFKIPQWVVSGNNAVPKLYIFTNSRYSEEHSCTPERVDVGDFYDVTFNLQCCATEGRIRFDPLESKYCKWELLDLTTNIGKIKCDINYVEMSVKNDNWIMFFTYDPNNRICRRFFTGG